MFLAWFLKGSPNGPFSGAARRVKPRQGCFVLACLIALVPETSHAVMDFQSVGLYPSFDELVVWANEFTAANPDITRLVDFGRSHQGRELLAVQITSGAGLNDPLKPEFLFTGGLHAREVIGSEVARRLAEHLVLGYRSGDAAFRDILAEREVWIVPNLNPDGRVRVEDGDSEQRKNMELFRQQCADNSSRGVDLNRNFPHRWADGDAHPTAEDYQGPSVLSTPEASALWSLVHDPSNFSDLRSAIDFHSGLGYTKEAILFPWASSDDSLENPLSPEDRAMFDFLAGRMGELTGFVPLGSVPDNVYGSLMDSLYEEFGTYAFAEEIYTGWSDPEAIAWFNEQFGPTFAYEYSTWDEPEVFAWFNPVEQTVIDDQSSKAITSSMFLLSDEAFAIVPEPSSLIALLSMAGLALVACARRRRRAEG
jgi:hypothetical protein